MPATLDPALTMRIEDAIRARIDPAALVKLDVRPYLDHHGEQALWITLVLTDDRFSEVDRLDVMSDVMDLLAAHHADLFPYTSLIREGEAA